MRAGSQLYGGTIGGTTPATIAGLSFFNGTMTDATKTVLAGAVMSIDGTDGANNTINCALTNNGTINFTSGSTAGPNLQLGATLTNNGWFNFNSVGASPYFSIAGAATINNQGTFTISNSGAGINAVAAQHPDAALFSAVNDKAEQNTLAQAAKQIKKIVIFDSPAVDPAPFASYVGSDAAARGFTGVGADLFKQLFKHRAADGALGRGDQSADGFHDPGEAGARRSVFSYGE